jgi:hypothetical protein
MLRKQLTWKLVNRKTKEEAVDKNKKEGTEDEFCHLEHISHSCVK